MAVTASESEYVKYRRWTIIFAGVSAFAALALLFVYWSQLRVMGKQLGVMEHTVKVMEENQRLVRRPTLKLDIRKDLEGNPLYSPSETKDGGQEWALPYYVHNIGESSAILPYDICYWHDMSTDSVINLPDSSLFQRRWAEHMLFPGEYRICGSDQLLRAVWMKRKDKGQDTYRHFVVKYRDEHGRLYGFHAVWRIKYENETLMFEPVSYQPITGF